MRLNICALATIGGVLAWANASAATTVRFDVVPTSNTAATSVTVRPGVEVPYQVYVQVTSDDTTTADNNGLSYFTLELLTDLTVTQPPLDSFSSTVADSFTILQALGTAQDDDIVEIGGGQNTLAGGTVVAGVGASGSWQLIGEGRFLTPTTEGTYTVSIGAETQANVLAAGSLTSASQATLQNGPGFTIVVAERPKADPVTKAVVYGGLVAVVILAAFFMSSPLAAMLAIVLLPLLFIVMLMNGF